MLESLLCSVDEAHHDLQATKSSWRKESHFFQMEHKLLGEDEYQRNAEVIGETDHFEEKWKQRAWS